MARILEIAQFDSTDSWEDRTLKKLNLNFRQLQGGFDFLQSSVLTAQSGANTTKDVIWENGNTTIDQGDFIVDLPYKQYDYFAIDFKLGKDTDYWYTQFVPYGKNFVLTQVSAGNAVPHNNGLCLYARSCIFDSANNQLSFSDLQLARPANSWTWTDDANSMIVGRICGIKF